MSDPHALGHPAAPPAGALVHIVDDDEAIRDSLAFLLASRGLVTREWPSGEAFLEAASTEGCCCVVMDVRMGELGGIETFERLRGRDAGTPVIFLTGHADVPIAVEALKKGAFDFVEKPFNDNALVDVVIAALAEAESRRSRVAGRGVLEARLKNLTPREAEVLPLLLGGRLNKQIADELGVAMRTVEVHRARIFEKMGVRNAVELTRLLGGAGD
ncbi:response regulator transcription factor [Methylobrevis pamukkalensis]|uniref:Response regulator protein TmoT n=1 Tax=Methylobrevis pamukkalensis TaxID=1439726 RepID=A0A1E3H445_9HYPH|nr:response regulator [Methylobrevis pamukkalensis]ODN71080.1 Response regulator protein TmoT [Methylobrevis pamukkalensis]